MKNQINTPPNNLLPDWWEHCYTAEDGQVFTPQFDHITGDMTCTGKETYDQWLSRCNAPAVPVPTVEQRTAALESAMLTMLGGATNV